MRKLFTKGLGAAIACAQLVSTGTPISAITMPAEPYAALPFAQEDALTEVMVDDNDPSIEYCEGSGNSGGWTAGSSSDYAVSEHWSNSPGATFVITFTGQAIELYGVKAPNHLKFSVSIDGQEAIVADAYGPSRTDGNALLFSSQEEGVSLEEGEHTLLLTLLSEANENAVNAQGMSFTYYKYFTSASTDPGEDPEPEPFPGYSIVEDGQITTGDELFKIHYNGEWSGGSSYYPNYFHDGYEHYAHSGDSFEMTFIGRGIEMVGDLNAAHGVYTVTLDGETAGEFSATTTGATQRQQVIFSLQDLEYGQHHIKVELVGQSDKAIQLDYLKVYHDPIDPMSVSLDTSALTLLPGGSTKLNAEIYPWVASETSLVWTSSNEDAVTVDQKGNLKAAEVTSKSTAEITVAAENNEAIKASAVVTVDPTLAVFNAYVGDEKLLDTENEYETLKVGQGNTYTGTLWRNDSINSKIVVSSMSRDLTGITVEISDFVNEKGTVLPEDAVTYGWLETVQANIGRGSSSAPVVNFPEKIANPGIIDLPAESVRFAWVTLKTEEDTQPGVYRGVIRVNADQIDEPLEFSYTLNVVDLLQPEMELTEIQLWQHPFSVANYYLGLGSTPVGGISNDVDNDFYFTPEHFDLMRDSMEEYVALGGHDAVANIVEEAWNHQSYYGDPSMVKWTKNTDGTWSFDYTWYDAWIEFMIETGVLNPEEGIGKIKAYSIVPWNNYVSWTDAATGKTTGQSLTPGTQSWKDVWTVFLTDYLQHSKEKGWLDITYISMDERGLELLEPAVELIRSITDEEGNGFKISSALNYSAPEYYDFTDQIDDISVNLGNTSLTTTNALSEHRREKGLTTTFYTCTGDYPSNFMISDPGDNYWDILYTIALGTDGYLRWAYDNFLYDMHGNATYRYWEPGDGWFFYPLERGSEELINGKNFYSTPRFEMFKQGVRDAAKVRWLLANDELSDEEKADLTEAIAAMSKPSQGGNGYGSATYSNAAARASVHAQTAAVFEAVKSVGAILEAKQAELPDAEAEKALLEMAIQYAEDYVALKGLDHVNVLVKARFESALNQARLVYADANATQEEVDRAWAELSYAIHLLDFTADKTGLQQMVEEAEAINPDTCKPGEALDEFLAALEHAREILDSDTALDQSIQEALDRLASAMAALEFEEIDTRLLAWLTAQVKDTDLDLYLEDGKPAFTEALENAQAVLADPASQEEVDEALQRLSTAWLNLRRAPDEDVLKQLQTFIEQVQQLDVAVYGQEKVEAAQALALEIQGKIDAGTLDQTQALNYLTQAQNMQKELVPLASSQTPEASAAGTKENLTKPASVEKSSTVNTAAAWSLGTTALLAMAAAGGFLALRRKNKEE